MAQPHALSGQVINLSPLAARLPDERTTAILKAEQLEVVRVVLTAGAAMPEHHVQGEITLLCLEGQIALHTPHGTRILGPADFIHLQRGEPHALKAMVDSLALLTICLAS